MIRREVKIGALIIAGFIIFIWGFSFLKGKNIFVSGTRYYGVYSYVEGLGEGSPIYYKGFRVGSVEDIRLHPRRDGDFLVSFILTEDLPVNNETLAQIFSVDLLGSMAVQLFIGEGNIPLSQGDTLKTGVLGDLKHQISMEMLPLRDKTELLLIRLDTVLSNVGKVLSDQNRAEISLAIEDLHLTLENLELATRALSASLADGGAINNSLGNIEHITSNLKAQSTNVDELMYNLTAVSHNLKEADIASVTRRADSLLLNLDKVTAGINRGEGSLGMLLNDPDLYDNLVEASANLDMLLEDIRQNPGRYLHFSAINLGRGASNIRSQDLARQKGISFSVKLASSNQPQNIYHKLEPQNITITEIVQDNLYLYTVGQTPSYPEALQILSNVNHQFPAAQVISFQNGKQISLQRALRKINVKN